TASRAIDQPVVDGGPADYQWRDRIKEATSEHKVVDPERAVKTSARTSRAPQRVLPFRIVKTQRLDDVQIRALANHQKDSFPGSHSINSVDKIPHQHDV